LAIAPWKDCIANPPLAPDVGKFYSSRPKNFPLADNQLFYIDILFLAWPMLSYLHGEMPKQY
jgi:hypothetical protein